MVTIGVDPHKETHSAVAVDSLGRELSKCTEPAVQDGFGLLLMGRERLITTTCGCWRIAGTCPVRLNGS